MVSKTVSVPDKGPTFMAVTGVLSGIAFLLVVYRLVHGWRFRKAIYTDDILIACSMTVQIITTIVGDLANHYGFGRHKTDIAKSGGNLVVALKYFWLFQVFYKIVLCLTKLSFLTFYLRIFPSKQFHRICHLTMGIVIGGVLGFVIATIFQCVPVAGSWEKNLPAKCINNAWFRWWWAGYNTASDIWICLLPMPLLARLQLNTVRKVGVMLMFALGLFVCVTSIVRIIALVQSVSTNDPTWGSWDALLWSAIEASTGIICACLPFLKHPLKQMFPQLFSSLGSKATHSRPTYKLSALSQRNRTHPNGEWQNLESSKVATGTGSIGTGDSEEAIVPGHIMMKTDISFKTERV